MKKIVIVQDHLRNGGTERQSLHLAHTLSTSGYDVTLLTFRPGGTLALIDETQKNKTPNPKHISLQPFDTHLDFFAPHLISTLRRIAPDIVICMGRMANCKAQKIARALPHSTVISTMRTGKKLPAAYIRSLHATHHTIANSHEAARLLRETYAVPAEKITVIHNAIVFPPDRVAQASRPCASDGTDAPPVGLSDRSAPPAPPLRLLCSAMFRREKNHRELLEIFSRIPHSAPAPELHLLGDGPELAPCRAIAQRLNIADRVHFHGYVSNPASFYQPPANANTIALLTSHSESLPNFLVEAHAHGIPSIAYAVGGVAECGGIAITPSDQPAFLAALNNLITSPDFRAAESARVAAHAREHFSPQTQLDRYLALFDKLIS